jgi:putative membrane protein
MIKFNHILLPVLGLACCIQSCSSPDKKEIKGDSVVNVGEGMDPKRDTGFAAQKDRAPQDANPGKNLRDYTNESRVNSDDATFMKEAALGGMMEVELGKLAQRSTNPQVKAFADLMVADHTKANLELKVLAGKAQILLPTEYYEDQVGHINMMKKLKGAEFDKHYVDMMIKDHQKTVTLFQSATETMSQDVKKFANKTLPVLNEHYRKARAIQL